MNSIGVALLAFAATLSVSHVSAGQAACNAGAPDFQQCVRSNLQHLIPQLANGLPSIGAEAIEPLQGLPSLRHSSASGLNVQLDDVAISGLSTAIVNDIYVDLATNTIRISSAVPAHIAATGVQTTDAEIMGIPLKGTGPFKLNIAQPSVELTLSGAPAVGPNGQAYLQLSSVAAQVQLGAASIEVGGFFSHFPPLEKAANLFANYVADAVLADLKPSVEQWLGSIVLQRAQAVFSSVPYDALFPGRTPAAFGLYRAIPSHPLSVLRPLPYHK